MQNSSLIIVPVIVGALFFGVGTAFAETASTTTTNASSTGTTEDKDQIIKRLQAKIVELEKTIKRLKGGILSPTSSLNGGNASSTHPGIGAFIRLKLGAAGIEVRKIQEWLRTMPDVYPSGLVTGYFGTMTEDAIKRFQKKHGLPETGVWDEATKTKFDSLFGTGASSSTTTTSVSDGALLRLSNGRGIPVCVVEEGGQSMNKYAKTLTEYRSLITGGGKSGMCRRGSMPPAPSSPVPTSTPASATTTTGS